MASAQVKDPWQQAIRLLTAADRSEHEIRSRLDARGHTEQTIEATIQRLRAAGYLNDARVAENAARSTVQRGHGSERARAQLLARGIHAGLVESAIEASFADELSLARAALRKRYRNPPSTDAECGRAARFLAQRGFPEAIVLAILGDRC